MSLPKLNTPTFELTLPSTGQKVKYRPFLVREHKILLTMGEADSKEVTRIVNELIDVCTFNKLDMKSLPYFDTEYIFMMLRSKSIGEKVDVVVNCDCGNKISTQFNIDNLRIEKNKDHNNKIMLTGTLGVEMKYPGIGDVINIFEKNSTDEVLELVAGSIKGIFDDSNYWDIKDQTKEEVEEFINSLTKEQFDKLEKFFLTAPKVIQDVVADCDQCGKHLENKLEGLENFFV